MFAKERSTLENQSSKSNFEMYGGDIHVLDVKNIFNDSVHDSFSEWDVVLLAGGEEIDEKSRHHTKIAGSEFESAL